MKDIVIKGKDIRRELLVFLSCFVAACIINLVSIIVFDRPWIELVSQIGYVVFITIGIYVFVAVIRVIVALVLKLIKRK